MLGGAGTSALLTTSCFSQPGPGPHATTQAATLGVRSDGRSDDRQALQAAIGRISASGGGELILSQGAVTVVNGPIIVLDNVDLNLNGGTIRLRLSARDAVGARLRSGATLRNGRIIVSSSGTPSLQAGVHAPVVVGPIYGQGGTPDRPSPDEGVSGWTIRDLVLSGDKDVDAGNGAHVGSAAIQVYGGAHNGLIENIEVADSPYLQAGVMLDWAFVGPISSSTIPTDAANFRNGRSYTTHPHQIVLRNIRIGRLSRPAGPSGGTFGIRLSGVHDISVSNVRIASVTGAAFFHTAGDLGFEFAPAAVKPLACRGIRIADGEVADGSTAYLIWTNSYADNVGREVARGYRAMMDPIHSTDIVFENIRGDGRGRADANYGIRVDHQRGGQVVDCTARGYRRGFYVDEQVDGLTLVRPVAIDNAEHGISVEHPSRPPRNVVVDSPIARGNGRRPGGQLASGVLIGRSENVEVIGGETPHDGVQRRGIRVTAESHRVQASGSAASSLVRE